VFGETVTSAPETGPLNVGDVVLVEQPDDGSWIVLRAPQVVTLVVTPERATPDAPGQMGIAIGGPSIPTRFGLVAAVVHGAELTGRLLHAMVTTLAQMFIGRAEVEIAGPVGISIMSRQMGEQGMVAFLRFMALLSLNLGILNLLPIPALDGGRLLFIAAEAVRGRRIEPSREAVVHLIGFVLVIGLMAVVTIMEVARLTGLSAP
jgi:regulator of sigma E protease